MPEYQIMRWREIPSMVIVRQGEVLIKVMLPPRFQEAIDEAAMRLGEIGADEYIAGWARDGWLPGEGPADFLAAQIVAELEEKYSEVHLEKYLNSLGNSQTNFQGEK